MVGILNCNLHSKALLMLSYTPWQKLPAGGLKENTHHKSVPASKHVCDLNLLLLSKG